MVKIIALIVLLIAIVLFVKYNAGYEYNRGLRRGEEVTRALDQMEGRLWIEEQIAKKSQQQSHGKELTNVAR